MTTILIKKKDTAGAPAAGDLTNAAGGTEIAVNTATKRIYTKDSGGNVVELGTNASAMVVGSLTDSGLTSGRVTYATTAGLLTDSASLTFDGTTFGSTAVINLAGAASSAVSLGTSQVAGTLTLGGTAQTGTITIGQSTKTHSIAIGGGATENALTKTIYVGTGGVSGSTTSLILGSAVSGSTSNLTLNTKNFRWNGTQFIVGADTTTSSSALVVNGAINAFPGAAEAQVHVQNATSDVYLYNSYAGNAVGLYDGTSAKGLFSYDRGSDVWSFLTAGATRFTIASNGNGTFGNTVNAGGLRYFDISNSSTTAGSGSIIRLITADVPGTGASTGDIVKYKAGGFVMNNTDSNAAAYSQLLVNGRGVSIDSAGNLTMVGGSSQVIYFNKSGALVNSGLNDYEEGSGSFSSVQKDNAGAGVSLSVNTYWYTKIGRFVHVQFRVLIASPTAASTWSLNGLPFSAAVSDCATGVILGPTGFPGKVNQLSGTSLSVFTIDAAGAAQNWPYLYGSVVYFV